MYDGSVLKGPRLEREKEGFVGADLADGKALFPVWPIRLYGCV